MWLVFFCGNDLEKNLLYSENGTPIGCPKLPRGLMADILELCPKSACPLSRGHLLILRAPLVLAGKMCFEICVWWKWQALSKSTCPQSDQMYFKIIKRTLGFSSIKKNTKKSLKKKGRILMQILLSLKKKNNYQADTSFVQIKCISKHSACLGQWSMPLLQLSSRFQWEHRAQGPGSDHEQLSHLTWLWDVPAHSTVYLVWSWELDCGVESVMWVCT